MTLETFLHSAPLLQLTEALLSKSDQVHVLLSPATKTRLTFCGVCPQVYLQLEGLSNHLNGGDSHTAGTVPDELHHIGQRVRRSCTTHYSWS